MRSCSLRKRMHGERKAGGEKKRERDNVRMSR